MLPHDVPRRKLVHLRRGSMGLPLPSSGDVYIGEQRQLCGHWVVARRFQRHRDGNCDTCGLRNEFVYAKKTVHTGIVPPGKFVRRNPTLLTRRAIANCWQLYNLRYPSHGLHIPIFRRYRRGPDCCVLGSHALLALRNCRRHYRMLDSDAHTFPQPLATQPPSAK